MSHNKFVSMTVALCAAAIFLQVGCGDDSGPTNGGGGGTDSAYVMLVYSLPGGPDVDLYLDTVRVRSRLSYPNNTGYIGISSGSHSVRAKLAGDTTTLVSIGPLPVTLSLRASVFASDTGASATPVVFYDTLTTPTPGKANVRFVNMAVGSLNVSAFVDTSTTAPATLAFKAGTGFRPIDAGQHSVEFRIGLTPVGMLSNFTFVAGKSYTIWLRGVVGGVGSLATGVEIITNN